MGQEELRMRFAVIPSLKSTLLAFPLLLAMQACEPVQFGTGATTTPPVDTSAATATFSVTNSIETDASKITINLYNSGAQDIEAAPVIKNLGDVETGKTVDFTVPAGSYKIGYSTVGRRQAMPEDTAVGQTQVWPVVTFNKGETHYLEIYTDAGGVETWRSDFYRH
jgi:hypothetical protein